MSISVKKVSYLEKLDLRWQRYLIKGLEPFINNPFFIEELLTSKVEVARRKSELMSGNYTERMALKSIALDLWMYKFIDWKMPEYYALCLTNFIDKGEYDYELIVSPIYLILGRNGRIHPQPSKRRGYLEGHSKLNNAYDDSVCVRIEKGTKRKDIKKFIDVYFDFIEANNYGPLHDKVGERDTHSNLNVLQVIYRCQQDGMTDPIEIANKLDAEYPKTGNKTWTADAVRLRLDAIGKKHANNYYAKSDYYYNLEQELEQETDREIEN